MKILTIIIMFTMLYPADVSLFNFDSSKNKGRWYTVNDGVMGGLSKGMFKYSEEGTGLFSGDLSLENNGGFSWLKGYDPDLDLTEIEEIVIRIKGDGRKYGLTLKNADRRMVMYHAAFFETKNNEWQEITLPLKDFKGYLYGQNVNPISSLNKTKVNEVGIILLDKNPGPFHLEIDWMQAKKQ